MVIAVADASDLESYSEDFGKLHQSLFEGPAIPHVILYFGLLTPGVTKQDH